MTAVSGDHTALIGLILGPGSRSHALPSSPAPSMHRPAPASAARLAQAMRKKFECVFDRGYCRRRGLNYQYKEGSNDYEVLEAGIRARAVHHHHQLTSGNSLSCVCLRIIPDVRVISKFKESITCRL